MGAIIRKEGLGSDPVVQTHEDALCLVFVETQLSAVTGQLGADATVAVVARTLAKMSPRARAEAAGLTLDAPAAEVLDRAAAVRGADEGPGT